MELLFTQREYFDWTMRVFDCGVEYSIISIPNQYPHSASIYRYQQIKSIIYIISDGTFPFSMDKRNAQ